MTSQYGAVAVTATMSVTVTVRDGYRCRWANSRCSRGGRCAIVGAAEYDVPLPFEVGHNASPHEGVASDANVALMDSNSSSALIAVTASIAVAGAAAGAAAAGGVRG